MDNQSYPEFYPGWSTVRLLGQGSFGKVYEIQRNLFGTVEKAALKVISIPSSKGEVDELYGNGYDDVSITAHFQNCLADIVREYNLMAAIKGHTNIVYCDDIRYIAHKDTFGWDIFIKMELLTPLTKSLKDTVRPGMVHKLGMDLSNALVLCKGRGIVHRDIKPQNIFVSDTGDYKLGDFGIAKTIEQTSGGTKIGTLNYMAPEVYNNQPYGASSDLYALGMVMYWLLNERRLPFFPLTSEVPNVSESNKARERRFSGEPIPAPKNGSDTLKAIVMKACAYNPEDRYQSAQEMLDDLIACANHVNEKKSDKKKKESGKKIKVSISKHQKQEEIRRTDDVSKDSNKKTVSISANNTSEKGPGINADPGLSRRDSTGTASGLLTQSDVVQTGSNSHPSDETVVVHNADSAEAEHAEQKQSVLTEQAQKTQSESIPEALNWEYTNGTLTLWGEGTMETIWPEEEKPWEQDRAMIRTIVIKEGITNISDHAFSDYPKLTHISIPNSVTDIGSRAFYKCAKLSGVMIPDGVVSIGESAFLGCGSLARIAIPDGVTRIGNYAFAECVGLTGIIIPDSVSSIGDYIFKGCTGLSSVSFANRISRIGAYAFKDCTGLTSILIPDSVTSIGYCAFSGCTGLISVSTPAGVRIGQKAFPLWTTVHQRFQ